MMQRFRENQVMARETDERNICRSKHAEDVYITELCSIAVKHCCSMPNGQCLGGC